MKEEKITWVQDAIDRIRKKMPVVAERSRNKIPYLTVDGILWIPLVWIMTAVLSGCQRQWQITG